MNRQLLLICKQKNTLPVIHSPYHTPISWPLHLPPSPCPPIHQIGLTPQRHLLASTLPPPHRPGLHTPQTWGNSLLQTAVQACCSDMPLFFLSQSIRAPFFSNPSSLPPSNSSTDEDISSRSKSTERDSTND